MKDQKLDEIQERKATLFKSLKGCKTLSNFIPLKFFFCCLLTLSVKLITFQPNLFSETPQILT